MGEVVNRGLAINLLLFVSEADPLNIHVVLRRKSWVFYVCICLCDRLVTAADWKRVNGGGNTLNIGKSRFVLHQNRSPLVKKMLARLRVYDQFLIQQCRK